MKYTALIVDIINSKKLPKSERNQVQQYIKSCVTTLNNIFRPSLKFDVIFSAGDEVQGLFNSATSAYLYFRLLKMISFPVQFRCGIGVGEWDIRINDGTSTEQDGAAFHNGRTSLLTAHNKKNFNSLLYSNNENDIIINTLINTSSLYVKKQSNYQKQINLLAELINPFYDNNSMILSKFTTITALLEEKTKLPFYIKNQTYKVINFNNIIIELEPLNIFSSKLIENNFLINYTLKKGLSSKISNIINTSRQNVDKLIISGNISQIRNIDIAILRLINKTFMG